MRVSCFQFCLESSSRPNNFEIFRNHAFENLNGAASPKNSAPGRKAQNDLASTRGFGDFIRRSHAPVRQIRRIEQQCQIMKSLGLKRLSRSSAPARAEAKSPPCFARTAIMAESFFSEMKTSFHICGRRFPKLTSRGK
jgi:hypothetical protein